MCRPQLTHDELSKAHLRRTTNSADNNVMKISDIMCWFVFIKRISSFNKNVITKLFIKNYKVYQPYASKLLQQVSTNIWVAQTNCGKMRIPQVNWSIKVNCYWRRKTKFHGTLKHDRKLIEIAIKINEIWRIN